MSGMNQVKAPVGEDHFAALLAPILSSCEQLALGNYHIQPTKVLILACRWTDKSQCLGKLELFPRVVAGLRVLRVFEAKSQRENPMAQEMGDLVE